MLKRKTARRILSTVLSGGGDFAEIFMERNSRTKIRLEDGKIEEFVTGVSKGVSIKVIEGDRIFFAANDSTEPTDLRRMAKDLSCAIQSMGGERKIRNKPLKFQRRNLKPYSVVQIDPQTVDIGQKVELLRRADKAARGRDSRVCQVLAAYNETVQEILVANSRGVFDRDKRVYPVLGVEVVAKEKDLIQRGYEVIAGTNGFEMFEERSPEDVSGEAVRSAIFQLEAQPAPAGTFVVVILGVAEPGVFIHEAVGHGFEGDHIESGMSVYSGKIGQRVASELVTVIDDGTMPGLRGTAKIDDEGEPVQRVVLIKDGVLVGYLLDVKSAKDLNLEPTGNGRREGSWNLSIPRMRNTFLAAGQSDPKEIMDSLENGIIITKMGGGGQVDPITGDFVFSAREGFWKENGKETPIRGVILVGNGPEVLENIVMVGNDISFSHGTCGKQEQSVPVSEGSPTIKIARLVVGGMVKEEKEGK